MHRMGGPAQGASGGKGAGAKAEPQLVRRAVSGATPLAEAIDPE